MKRNGALWDADLETRYQASIHHPNDKAGNWPRGCWGAANAWLMLCGPSPGAPDDENDVWPGGPNCPLDSNVTIGLGSCPFVFATNKARNARWLKLACAATGEQNRAEALSCLVNLDWGHHANNADIPEQYLKDGCRRVLDMMEEAQPRVVITLVERTWWTLTDFLEKDRVPNFPEPNAELLHEPPLVIQIPGAKHRTVVLKSPQHPSRHFFNDTHAAKITAAVQWFLQADAARS
jgi:hypothetical protein